MNIYMFACFVYCCFMFLARSYPEGYRLVTVHIHGDSLGQQATTLWTCYTNQSHYTDTEPTSPCLILIRPSARLGSDKCQS